MPVRQRVSKKALVKKPAVIDTMNVRFFGGPMHGKVTNLASTTRTLVYAEPELNAEYHYTLEQDGSEYRALLKTIFPHDRKAAIMLGLPIRPPK
jgi:hypothetical protein